MAALLLVRAVASPTPEVCDQVGGTIKPCDGGRLNTRLSHAQPGAFNYSRSARDIKEPARVRRNDKRGGGGREGEMEEGGGRRGGGEGRRRDVRRNESLSATYWPLFHAVKQAYRERLLRFPHNDGFWLFLLKKKL